MPIFNDEVVRINIVTLAHRFGIDGVSFRQVRCCSLRLPCIWFALFSEFICIHAASLLLSITHAKVQGVIKNIMPAIGATNAAVAAVCCNEAFKCVPAFSSLTYP